MVVDELLDGLYKKVNRVGLDLAANNLQQGRDHGIPGKGSFHFPQLLAQAGSVRSLGFEEKEHGYLVEPWDCESKHVLLGVPTSMEVLDL